MMYFPVDRGRRSLFWSDIICRANLLAATFVFCGYGMYSSDTGFKEDRIPPSPISLTLSIAQLALLIQQWGKLRPENTGFYFFQYVLFYFGAPSILGQPLRDPVKYIYFLSFLVTIFSPRTIDDGWIHIPRWTWGKGSKDEVIESDADRYWKAQLTQAGNCGRRLKSTAHMRICGQPVDSLPPDTGSRSILPPCAREHFEVPALTPAPLLELRHRGDYSLVKKMKFLASLRSPDRR
jgi:hypothetical protein